LVRRALASVSSDATPRVIERETTDVIEVVEPSGSMPTCVIGLVASTGGPPAVQHIVRALPGGMPAAVVVAQHMPARFTPAFAERLDRLGSVRVVQARDGQPLCAGVVYVAPGATDLEIERDAHSAAPHVRLVSPQRRRPPPITPSGDRLFDSL